MTRDELHDGDDGSLAWGLLFGVPGGYTVLKTAKLHGVDPAAYIAAAAIAAGRGEVLPPWQLRL